MSNQKTLDDLAKQVIDSQQGLMSVEDLKVFFEDTPQVTVPANQTAAEPVSALAPQAPAVTTAVTAEPVVRQPNILEFVPEKFKGDDPVASVQKLTKSYAELEAELIKEKEERANLDRMVHSLSTTAPVSDTSQVVPGIPSSTDMEDVEDSLFFEKPKEATTKVSKKVASEVAAAMLIAYHNALTEASKRMQYVEAFKAEHPDFNNYREDMAAILKARPELDKRVDSLPTVYEMAKARYRARLEQMRRELGVTTTPQTPTVPVVPAQPVMTEAELVDKVKAAIIAEIQKRKAASGLTGGGTPTSPTDRATPVVTQVPKTVEDQIFDDMMAAGPKKLAIDL
jgi:hypothetical protein